MFLTYTTNVARGLRSRHKQPTRPRYMRTKSEQISESEQILQPAILFCKIIREGTIEAERGKGILNRLLFAIT